MQIDTSTEFGARVARRLRDETVMWLTTVRADGSPDPSPIWFHWDGESLLIYSQPNTPKLRNIERSPNVALNFDGDGKGGDIIVINGQARIAPDEPPAHQVHDYAAKYVEGFRRIGMTPEQFSQAYSVPIRVTPTRVRGH
jgi:PPOX class probable F420-dependent enzyme